MGYPGLETFVYVVYPEVFIALLLISGTSGILFSVFFKLHVRTTAIAKDALYGAIVSFICTYSLGHFDFEYTFIVAVMVAVALPAMHEFYRFRHMRRG